MWLVVSTQITTGMYRDVDLHTEREERKKGKGGERDREIEREERRERLVIIMRFSGVTSIQLRLPGGYTVI